jgi:hypothetical protein
MSEKVLLAIMESFYATGAIEPGSAEDDPETAVDFLKYLKGYDVVPEDSLDSAWAEAEAALPEGWRLDEITWDNGRAEWVATAALYEAEYPADAGYSDYMTGWSETPAAALQSLAAKLRDPEMMHRRPRAF